MTNTTTSGTYNHYARSKTVTVKKIKAKNLANQPGLDRLQELLVKATANPAGGQNFANTIKRALRSLQECKHPILTQQDAVKLRYVGPAMAKKICPQSTTAQAGTLAAANKAAANKAAASTSSASKTKTTKNHSGSSNSSSKNNNNNHNNNKCKRAPDTGDNHCDNTDIDNDNDNDNNCNGMQQLASTSTSTIHRRHFDDVASRKRPLVCSTQSIPSRLKLSPAACSSNVREHSKLTSKEAAYETTKQGAEALAHALPARGPWKVILLVDNREHKSKQVVSSCKQAGIPCEERQLAIGDMAWIARCRYSVEKDGASASQNQQTHARKSKDNNNNSNNKSNQVIEVLLGTIVERKEVSDLASSLFGTRYAEQRLRLSKCGLPQVLFLVEGDLSSLSNCPSDTLQMAMMETRLQLGFSVLRTQNLVDTVGILKTLHSRIVQRTFPEAYGRNQQQRQVLPAFGGGNRRRNRPDRRASSLLELVFDTPPVPPFGKPRFITYPELKAKVELDRERGTRSVGALTLAMLKQIPTLSQKKCMAISNHYPTYSGLLKALSYPTSNTQLPRLVLGGMATSTSTHAAAAVTTTTTTRKAPPPAAHRTKIIKDIEIENGRGRTIGPSSASEVYTACCTLEDGSTVDCHSQQQPTKNAAMITVAAGRRTVAATATATSTTTTMTMTTTAATTAATMALHCSDTTKMIGAKKPPPPGIVTEVTAQGLLLPSTTFQRSTADLFDSPSSSPKATRRDVAIQNQVDSPYSFSPSIGVGIGSLSSTEDNGTNHGTVRSGTRKNTTDFTVDSSSPGHKHKMHQETVDLLTPEAPRLGAKLFPTDGLTIRAMTDHPAWLGHDSDDDSDISNDRGDSDNPTPKTIDWKALPTTASRTTNSLNATSSSRVASDASTNYSAITKPNASQRQQAETVLLLSSSSEDEDDFDGSLLPDDAIRTKSASTTSVTCHNANKRAFSNATTIQNPRAHNSLTAPQPITSAQGRKDSLASAADLSSDDSALFSSPEASRCSLLTPTGAIAQRPRNNDEKADGHTKTTSGSKCNPRTLGAPSEKVGAKGAPIPVVVSLLDKDDDDSDGDRNDCNDTSVRAGGVAEELSVETKGDVRYVTEAPLPDRHCGIGGGAAPAPAATTAASSLLLDGDKTPPSNVTTKRGGGSLYFSPTSSCSSPSSAMADRGQGEKDPDIGRSLRERLEAKRTGTKTVTNSIRRGTSASQQQEVIEIDSDDDDDDDGD